MSAHTRWVAQQRAKGKGSDAREAGKPQSANPYKPSGDWTLHPWWDMGWMERDREIERGKSNG